MLRKVLLLSFLLKVTILSVIFTVNSGDYTGYNTNLITSDDVRYVSGALYYSENAASIIDAEVFKYAFEMQGDYTGSSDRIALWYWFICIFVYATNSIFLVSVINILFSILTAYYLFKLGNLLFEESSAMFAAILYSFSPYFLIFPLFLYKDQLIALLTVQLFYVVNKFLQLSQLRYLSYVVIILAIFSMLRSGFVLLVAAAAMFLIYRGESEFRREHGLKSASSLIVLLAAVSLLLPIWLISNFELIQTKAVSYIVERTIAENATIRFFQISSFSDLYKLPFAFAFGLLQPVNLTQPVSSFGAFIGIINITGVFLASASLLCFFIGRFLRLRLFWVINALFVITLISSLGISRHYYFLMPFYTLFSSAFLLEYDRYRLTIFISVSLAMALIFYSLKSFL